MKTDLTILIVRFAHLLICGSFHGCNKTGVSELGQLFNELKRRNIFRVAVAYIIVAWLLMKCVHILIGLLAFSPWAEAFFIFILIAGFPIALMLSWAYEITPEGMKRSDAVDEPKSITHQTGRTLNRIIILGMVLVIIYRILENGGYLPQLEPQEVPPSNISQSDVDG